MQENTIKPLIVSAHEYTTGAGRAATRLHRALRLNETKSTMLVGTKSTDDWTVECPTSGSYKVRRALYELLDRRICRLRCSANQVHHSIGLLGALDGVARSIEKKHDLINVHWTNAGTLSLKQISLFTRPLVFTLHDMWLFCGAEHYAPEDANPRWISGYNRNNLKKERTGIDIDRIAWNLKRKHLSSILDVVAPSQWMANCASRSALLQKSNIHVIPNALDTEIFSPKDKRIARQILGLPMDRRLILFGAMEGVADKRKGWDLLSDSLKRISSQRSNYDGVILGQSKPQVEPQLGMPLHWLGRLGDDIALALAYSAADVLVVPSRQDNLPQSATEAVSCGCPVVAFNIGGMPDIVENGITGYLADPFDIDSLTHGILAIAEHTNTPLLRDTCRRRAQQNWSPRVVSRRYNEVFNLAIERQRK